MAEITTDHLAEHRRLLAPDIVPGQRWLHYRGTLYQVVAVTHDRSEPFLLRVAYVSLSTGLTWSRTLDEWRETVDVGGGLMVPAFALYREGGGG